ncbi:unnamed protein product [Paramecium primaurelia]|uniref:Uncharacterized protein n=1 Tax=Paramecium primaurelia TaxID=5886 RepID=A0A8S1L5H7_PARPR|nr:unnamed protein product [Paramecium primaurelia]
MNYQKNQHLKFIFNDFIQQVRGFKDYSLKQIVFINITNNISGKRILNVFLKIYKEELIEEIKIQKFWSVISISKLEKYTNKIFFSLMESIFNVSKTESILKKELNDR